MLHAKKKNDQTGSDTSPLNKALLVKNAIQHIAFLRKLHELGVTLEKPSSKSLDRYVNFWLPLVADSTADCEELKLIPPPDIAWLWHCHRLAPFRYKAYVERHFGRMIEAAAQFEFQYENGEQNVSSAQTKVVWSLNFPDEPFFLQKRGLRDDNLSSKLLDVDGFDLLESSSRQSLFLWQVSQPRFDDVVFLEDGVCKYRQFLALQQENKALHLVPTFQIDLMWHTHIATSVTKYNEDCINIRGQTFNHDDSLDDRTPGAPLDLSFQETCRLWKKVYGAEYVVPGAMFRGNPPPEFFQPSWHKCASYTAVSDLPVPLAGSNSTGTNDTKPWRSPNKNDFTFLKLVLPSKSRSPFKSRGKVVNSAPSKDGYIFGEGCAGKGYYSFETKDAYGILHARLKRQEQILKSDYNRFLGGPMGRLRRLLMGNGKYVQLKKSKQDEIVKTVEILAYVDARRASNGPNVPLTDAYVKKLRTKHLHRHGLQGHQPYEPGYWTRYDDSNAQHRQDKFADYFVIAMCTLPLTSGGGICGGAGCGSVADSGAGGGHFGGNGRNSVGYGGGCGGGGGGCGGGGCGGG